MEINYYSILNLKRHCTNDDVHRAYAFPRKVRMSTI